MPSVTLLLGSGVSLSAGMPSTQEITQLVVSGQGAWRHTDERYYLSDPLPGYLPHPEHVPLILRFLSSLSKVAADYYRLASADQPSYEELFYLARQVADCETQEYDNPAVFPLCRRLRRELNPRLREASTFDSGYWNLARLGDETCSYIADLASHVLSERPTTTEHIALLLRAFCAVGSGGGAIVTLNHDTALEMALSAVAIPYTDGFSSLTREIARWDPQSLTRESALRLLKVHGSVDWHWVRIRDRDTQSDFLARILLGADHYRLRLPDGTEAMVHSGRPIMLVGTHNKILNYSGEIFLTLFYRFSEAMQASTALVVCGYGFRDKGINRALVEWIEANRDRVMTVIHPDPDELCAKARGAISLRWDSWLKRKRIRVVPKRLEELGPTDLKEAFTSDPWPGRGSDRG